MHAAFGEFAEVLVRVGNLDGIAIPKPPVDWPPIFITYCEFEDGPQIVLGCAIRDVSCAHGSRVNGRRKREYDNAIKLQVD